MGVGVYAGARVDSGRGRRGSSEGYAPCVEIPRSTARPLYDAAGARGVDAWAIGICGIPGEQLMAAAARAAARVARGRFPRARTVAVVCGSGNNGGDGHMVAHLLRRAGREARIIRVAGGEATGDAAGTLAAARAAGVPVVERPDGDIGADLEGADLIVDALLGTGAEGAPTGRARIAIEAMGAVPAPVLALDVPSGVDASTGEVVGVAVAAEVTVAFHADKVGLRVAPGRDLAGEVVVVPIGVPPGAPIEPAAVALADPRGLLPRRSLGGSKYDAGAVLVVGGAPGMGGAPSLTAAAALRAGAGLVHCAVPVSIQPLVAAWNREVMVHALPMDDPEPILLDLVRRVDVVAVGPGIGRSAPADRLIDALLEVDRPLVVDADGLWWLGDDLGRLRGRSAGTVVTPHAGEAARLLDRDTDAIAARRLDAARALAERSGAVALLKGADTLVVDPGGRVGVRDGACAALATAGSGDVLTGIIAAFAARAVDPWTAALAAAAVHLAAGRRAAAARSGGAIMAGDLIEGLRADGAPVDRRGSAR